ncbi:MAG: hypothetical protein CMF22_05460 [Idiomarinaceae bacterium]|nr:hypothetical protein [Idiomarinaceae bacterium]|tara:strand:- start:747 stop:1190 length:444 start_codon:yes stop_codon:yes gene_type:complete
MLKVVLLLMLALCSSNSFAYEKVSFYKLIVSPQSYEGKDIQLVGYFVSDGEGCLVMSNDKETALMYREYEMVRFCSNDLERDADSHKLKKFEDNYGAVSAKFSVKQCSDELMLGSELSYLGCLSQVTHLLGPIYEGGPRMPSPPLEN